MPLVRVVRRALVHHRGRAVGERPVDDVGVAGDPADVGAAPVHVLLGVEVEHVAMRRADARSGSRRWCAGSPSASPSSRACRGCTADPRRPSARPGTPRRPPSTISWYQTSRPSFISHSVPLERDDDDVLERVEIAHHRRRRSALIARDLALARGAVDGDQRLRVGELHPLAHRLGGEAAEDDVVRRADARAGEHRDRRPRGSSAGRSRRRRPCGCRDPSARSRTSAPRPSRSA